MLNPPLSLLSDDLLCYIVDHVAGLPYSNSDLYNLSITDRAFTRSCQAYIFEELRVGYGLGFLAFTALSRNLAKIRNILNDDPSIANRVRAIHLNITSRQNNWFFNDGDFITIIQYLAKSLMPPHKLHLNGRWVKFIIEDPIFVVEWLRQSFLSQSLTVLNLDHCKNVPLTIFLVLPNLRKVHLDRVEVFDDEYFNKQCSGWELPALEHLNYCDSGGLVRQMVTPPPRFPIAVVVWSRLRVLKLRNQFERAREEDWEDMLWLQLILDAACNTLEELYVYQQEPSLAGLVNLRHLPNFHIFSFRGFVECDAHEPVPVVSRDIIPILSTIPNANQVTQLAFHFDIYGKHPYGECLEQDWVGMCEEVVRISAGKPLELYLELSMVPLFGQFSGGDELYERIKEKISYLSDYPIICTHLWHSLVIPI